MFIVVADTLGGPPKARYSFGPSQSAVGHETEPNKLVLLTDKPTPTDEQDIEAWRQLADPSVSTNMIVETKVINGTDEEVMAAGDFVVQALGTPDQPGDIDYEPVTEIGNSTEANSNSAAYAIPMLVIGQGQEEQELPVPFGFTNPFGFGQFGRVIDELKDDSGYLSWCQSRPSGCWGL